MLTLKRNTLKKTAIALGTAVAMGGVVASANPAAAGHNPCHPAVVYSPCRAANPCAATNTYNCQRRSKISPPGRSKTSPLNVMRYAVLGG